MKRKSCRLTEVQLKQPRPGPPPALIWPGAGVGAAFAVHLPEGATVAVPAGFDADEVFSLHLTPQAWHRACQQPAAPTA